MGSIVTYAAYNSKLSNQQVEIIQMLYKKGYTTKAIQTKVKNDWGLDITEKVINRKRPLSMQKRNIRVRSN